MDSRPVDNLPASPCCGASRARRRVDAGGLGSADLRCLCSDDPDGQEPVDGESRAGTDPFASETRSLMLASPAYAGLMARMIAECIPGAAWWVNVTSAPANPAAASPSRYSDLDSAPAMQPT